MLRVKDLVLAIEEYVSNSPQPIPESLEKVAKAAKEVRELLLSSKGFEYEGKISMKYSNCIKLVDISTDFDDIIKALVGKKTDIETQGALLLFLTPDPVDEPKPDAKAL